MISRGFLLDRIRKLEARAARAETEALKRADAYAPLGSGAAALGAREIFQLGWLQGELKDIARELGWLAEDVAPKRARRARKAA